MPSASKFVGAASAAAEDPSSRLPAATRPTDPPPAPWLPWPIGSAAPITSDTREAAIEAARAGPSRRARTAPEPRSPPSGVRANPTPRAMDEAAAGDAAAMAAKIAARTIAWR